MVDKMGELVDAGPSVHDNPLDIEQIYSKARNQWLSRPLICQLLQNHKGFPITSAPHDKPPSGSLFLFDKKVQKHYRNDGHNWKMKKNGKTLSEGHQRFEVKGYGNLNCYYARGEENRNFLRRCYWMPKRDFSHIVLAHYLEETHCEDLLKSYLNPPMSTVTEASYITDAHGESGDGSCAEEAQVSVPYSQGQESVEIMPNSNIDSSMCPGSHPNNCQVLTVSECTDTALLTHDAQALEHENAQSEYNHQASSGFHSGLELRQPAAEQIDAGGSDPKVPLFYSNSIHESLSTIPDKESDPTQLNIGNGDTDAELAQVTDDLWTSLDFTILKDKWESFTPCGESIEHGSLSSSSHPDTLGKFVSNKVVKRLDFGGHLQIQEKSKASVAGSSSLSESACELTSKFHVQDGDHLELMDSVDPQQKRPDLRNNNSKENHFQRLLSNERHGYVLPPDSDGDSKFEGKLIYSSSIGQHLFNELLTEQGSKKRSSSGDNGETGENENENDVLSIPSEGKLDIQGINAAENYSESAKAILLLHFDKILCSGSSATNHVTSSLEDASQLNSKISSLLKGDNKELDQMLKTGSGMEFSFDTFKDQLLQKHLKEKLHVWILQKVAEGGDGPSILEEGGLGVLHLAAALGYDWALEPTILAGVSVDFRDVNGWTALHWAAFCGRQQAVASLISLGAAPGALTDRSPKYPSGRTPTDLACANGHKGIAGYLADRSSEVYIPSINLDHQDDAAGPKAVEKISEISAAPLSLGNASDGQSQKDSLAPICDATTELNVLRNRDQNLSENKCFQSSLKKLVLRVYMPSDKTKQRFIKTVGGLPGVDSIAVKMKAQQMEVIGTMDPVLVVCKLRKKSLTDIVSVGPAKELNEGKMQDEQYERHKRNERNGEEDEEEKAEEGPEGKGLQKDKGLGKDEGTEKEKQKGKKRAPDPGLENEKAHKILKAYLAYKALLTSYYKAQSMEKIKLLGSVFVDALKKIRGRKLSHIDGGFEPSAIRVWGRKHRRNQVSVP